MKLLSTTIRLLAFPFLADPPVPQHQKYKGIIEFPGFHTTSGFDVAAIYAIGRVDQNFTVYPDDGDPAYVTDYPVVVELDMSNYEKHTDYDAEEIVKETLEIHLNEFVSEVYIDETTTDDEIETMLQNFEDMADIQYSEYNDSPLDFLGEHTFMYFNTPLSGILNRPDAANVIREYIETDKIPSDVLMDITDQYRYIDDIAEQQIVSVSYVLPVANEMSDYEDETVDEKWPGFDIIGPDEAYGGYFSPTEHTVWKRPYEGATEFHGTTYNRLLSAAPFLANEIPPPPSPPFLEA